jgi:hypothetical protein
MTIRTALMFPGVIFAMFFILDLLVWGQKSSGAVPFGTLVAICFLWFGVSVPLVFVGSYFGFKKPAPEDPVRTNKIPRQIPEQPWYMHPVFSCLVGGVLPFGAVFIGECLALCVCGLGMGMGGGTWVLCSLHLGPCAAGEMTGSWLPGPCQHAATGLLACHSSRGSLPPCNHVPGTQEGACPLSAA